MRNLNICWKSIKYLELKRNPRVGQKIDILFLRFKRKLASTYKCLVAQVDTVLLGPQPACNAQLDSSPLSPAPLLWLHVLEDTNLLILRCISRLRLYHWENSKNPFSCVDFRVFFAACFYGLIMISCKFKIILELQYNWSFNIKWWCFLLPYYVVQRYLSFDPALLASLYARRD